jgi:diguanylate cyclase (GGDEF)-like protein
MTVDHEKKEAEILCEKAEPGYWPEHAQDDDIITYELMQNWETAIGVSNELIIKNDQDMDELAVTQPEWAASMRESGVESLIIAPLKREQTIIGYLYVINYIVEKTVAVKEMIELLAFFLGIWISNHQLVAKLEEISSIDALTGLNNRRSMVKRVDRLTGTIKPCGVVNLDLNGLKLINDRDGHDAGDRLLVRAGELLRKVFYDEDIYRTGGDEFIVIIEGIDEDVFERKIGKLRDAAEKYDDVSFAIGACWTEGHDKLTEMFRTADKRMYEDKLAYYRRSGQETRQKFSVHKELRGKDRS